jgi:hypothetical protein
MQMPWKEPRLSVKRTEVVRRKDPRDSERGTSRPATHGSVDDELVNFRELNYSLSLSVRLKQRRLQWVSE